MTTSLNSSSAGYRPRTATPNLALSCHHWKEIASGGSLELLRSCGNYYYQARWVRLLHEHSLYFELMMATNSQIPNSPPFEQTGGVRSAPARFQRKSPSKVEKVWLIRRYTEQNSHPNKSSFFHWSMGCAAVFYALTFLPDNFDE